MNWLQRIFAGHSRPGGTASDFERESREWKVDCRKCGHRSDVWQMGGVRWKAAGEKWQLLRCRGCGKLGRLKIHLVRGESVR